MGVIRILPDRVANQIAAGEVVERPASIVKELIENALDAGATRVELEFRHGGRSFIRVEDNGTGMARDDALLSLERHATSKIREASDLNQVTSFGFRGEALPSIASVSRFTLQSRTAATETGTEILVNGGKLLHERACGMPVGTRIVVANLFNSVPARRKFLKSDATESAHIIHHARLYALANPQVSFLLIEDGRTIFQSPVCTSLAERVAEVFGRQLATGLVPLEAAEEPLRLDGLISRPGLARATRHEMVTFVNRRPVDSRTLAYAILESYHTSLPKGRYPVAFLFLDIPPAGVDVNVHPAKRDVRFRDEVQVRGFTIRAVLGTLRALRGETLPGTPVGAGIGGATGRPGEVRGVGREPDAAPRPDGQAGRGPRPANPPSSAPAVEPAQARTSPVSASRPATPPPAPRVIRAGWRHLGDIAGGYSVFETSGGLILMDRVAAAERVWFERLRRREGGAPIESQRLLLPVPLELDSISAAALSEGAAYLRECGVRIEPFGRDFFRIESIPGWLEPPAAESFVRDLVARLVSGRADRREAAHLRDELARVAAARAAAPAQVIPSPEARERLVTDLLHCENPHSSPAGRPVLLEISAGELARRFQKQAGPRRVQEV